MRLRRLIICSGIAGLALALLAPVALADSNTPTYCQLVRCAHHSTHHSHGWNWIAGGAFLVVASLGVIVRLVIAVRSGSRPTVRYVLSARRPQPAEIGRAARAVRDGRLLDAATLINGSPPAPSPARRADPESAEVAYALRPLPSPPARDGFHGSATRMRSKVGTPVDARERAVEHAALLTDDAAFAPDAVREAAAALFGEVQTAWSAGDLDRLGALMDQEPLAAQAERLREFTARVWRNRVEVIGRPQVHYLGLRHDLGRVVVRINARVHDYVVDPAGERLSRDGGSDEQSVREYWTLERRSGRWVVVGVEPLSGGGHVLSDELIPAG